jgi:hypothetical protein
MKNIRRALGRVLIAGLFRGTRPISYHKCSIALSLAFFKVFQLLVRNCQYWLRGLYFAASPRCLSPTQKTHLEKLKSDIDQVGVSMISDYFPDDIFQRILEDFDHILADIPALPFRAGGTIKTATIYEGDKGDSAERLFNLIAKDRLLLSMVEHIHRRPVSILPRISLQEIAMPPDQANVPEPNAILHSDRHYHHGKAFFYLNDLDSSNGAYLYALNSNRVGSFWRFVHEVDLDFRESFAKWRRRFGLRPSDLSIAGIEQIRPSIMRRMNCPVSSMSGKRNTFLFSDNIGFHARGQMAAGSVRRQIHIHFTYLEVSFSANLIRHLVLAVRPAWRNIVI